MEKNWSFLHSQFGLYEMTLQETLGTRLVGNLRWQGNLLNQSPILLVAAWMFYGLPFLDREKVRKKEKLMDLVMDADKIVCIPLPHEVTSDVWEKVCCSDKTNSTRRNTGITFYISFQRIIRNEFMKKYIILQNKKNRLHFDSEANQGSKLNPQDGVIRRI